MNDTENARARKEALESSGSAAASASRARLMAGLNRYLTAEAAHEHRAAEEDSKEDSGPAPDAP